MYNFFLQKTFNSIYFYLTKFLKLIMSRSFFHQMLTKSLPFIYKLLVLLIMFFVFRSAYRIVGPDIGTWFMPLYVPDSFKQEIKYLDPSQYWLDGGDFFVLTTKLTPVHYRPQLKSRKTDPLPALSRIRVYQDTAKSENDNWLFVSNLNKSPIGWISASSVAYRSSFSPLNNWEKQSFQFQQGQKFVVFNIHQSGKFNTSWKTIGGSINLEGTQKGQLYVFKNLYWANVESPLDQDYFFSINDEGVMTQEFNYLNNTIKLTVP